MIHGYVGDSRIGDSWVGDSGVGDSGMGDSGMGDSRMGIPQALISSPAMRLYVTLVYDMLLLYLKGKYILSWC